jgi:hypothetical protein
MKSDQTPRPVDKVVVLPEVPKTYRLGEGSGREQIASVTEHTTESLADKKSKER